MVRRSSALPAILAAALVAVLTSPAASTNLANGDELARMVGKGAAELERDDSLRALLDGGHPGESSAYKPWHVWSYDDALGGRRYVVFAASPIAILPGSSGGMVVLLSGTGQELGRWRFSTGWRIDIQTADLERDDELRARVIKIHTEPMVNGRDVITQFLALSRDRLTFVRAEDSRGQLVRNDYTAPNHTLGGKPPADSVAGWKALLDSDDPIAQLGALVYLGGRHAARGARDSTPDIERDARTAHDLKAAPDTVARLARLRRARHHWVRQAAALASSPP